MVGIAQPCHLLVRKKKKRKLKKVMEEMGFAYGFEFGLLSSKHVFYGGTLFFFFSLFITGPSLYQGKSTPVRVISVFLLEWQFSL